MSTNHLEALTYNDAEIQVDISQLDIFYDAPKTTYNWKPRYIKPYAEVRYAVLDIETTRVDFSLNPFNPRRGTVKMVGVETCTGEQYIYWDNDEAKLLTQLDSLMRSLQLDVFYTFNGMGFDLPLLEARYDFNNLPNPLWHKNFPRTHRACITAGAPHAAEYVECCSVWGAHVDLLQMLYSWDSVARKLDSYSLKQSVVQMRLRPENGREELTMEEMEDAYAAGVNSEPGKRMVSYLKSDLNDTRLLSDFLMPAIWCQLAIFPMKDIQTLAIAGAASKWQLLLAKHYPKSYIDNLGYDLRKKFKGGLTYAVPGIFRNVLEADVSSLYPSALLKYGLGPRTDYLGVMHGALQYIFTEKVKLDVKKDEVGLTPAEANMRGAYKLAANTAYGMLASEVPFGDYDMAALVTGYGRAIVTHMRNIITEDNGKIVLSDTDSVFFTHANLDDAYVNLQQKLPDGISINKEEPYKIYFIPPKNPPSTYSKSYKYKTANGRKFVDKTIAAGAIIPVELMEEKVSYDTIVQIAKHNDVILEYEALRKNYIKMWSETKYAPKGKFNKRNSSWLTRNFILECLRCIIRDEDPSVLYHRLHREISNGSFPVDKLWRRRKIAKNETTVVKLGLGKYGDFINEYEGLSGPTTSGSYNTDHYIKELNELWELFSCCI